MSIENLECELGSFIKVMYLDNKPISHIKIRILMLLVAVLEKMIKLLLKKLFMLQISVTKDYISKKHLRAHFNHGKKGKR